MSLNERGLPEFDPDHQPLAAHALDKFVAFDERLEESKKLLAAPGCVLDQTLGFDHFQRRETRRHRQIVLREGRTVHDHAVHPIENALEYLAAHEHRADRHMAARQSFGEQHHIRLDIPVFDRQKASRPAHAGLNLIGDEQSAIFGA